jgi:isopenicillin N synthase-like dioxygenase
MDSIKMNDFQDKGFVAVPYPAGLRSKVEEAVSAWERFCRLPESIKLNFPYGSDTGMGVGYELKKTPGANLDVKEDFHFTTGARENLINIARSLKNTEAANFIKSADELVELMEPFVLDFAELLQKQFLIENLRSEVVESKPAWFVRFLHYFGGRRMDEEIATPHADKSGFTLHLYESDPGLEYLDRKKHWRPMPVSETETVIIPGMRMQYRSQNRLKATYHRVVATPKTAEDGRFSMVCFVHLTWTPEYNKKKSGRLQEFQPGFNYDMPFEEFSKLFI